MNRRRFRLSKSAKIRHPASGCTQAQRRAFEAIATGQDGGHHPKSIAALLEKGLILQSWRVVGRDALGDIEVPGYWVPFNTHIRWCEWCSAQPEAREP